MLGPLGGQPGVWNPGVVCEVWAYENVLFSSLRGCSLASFGLPEAFPGPKGHVNRPSGTMSELKSGNALRDKPGLSDLVGRGARKSWQSLPQRANDKGAGEAIWSRAFVV